MEGSINESDSVNVNNSKNENNLQSNQSKSSNKIQAYCKSSIEETVLEDHTKTSVSLSEPISSMENADIFPDVDCSMNGNNSEIQNNFQSLTNNQNVDIEIVTTINNLITKNLPENCDTNQELSNSSNNKSEDTKSKTEYRCDDTDSWSDDEDSSSTLSISSSDSDTFFDNLHESSGPKKFNMVKTKGELDLDDLPPIEDLEISVSEEEMEKIGVIHAIVDKLVVIRSFKDSKPIDLDSVLFLAADKPLGRVFDVFGPVVEPFYSIRFNSTDDISKKGIEQNMDIFFAPNKADITSYVFVEELQGQKGSDASWKHNNEPPEEFLDYSDDEQEKAAKRKRMAKNRNRSINNANHADIANKRPAFQNGTQERSIYIHSSRLVNSQNRFNRHPRPNPFQERTMPPPPSPLPLLKSILNLRSPSPAPNVYVPPPTLVSTPLPVLSPQPAPFPTNFQRPPPQRAILVPTYHAPPIFGQSPTISPVSPALRVPVSFHSPVLYSAPTLIPARPPPPVNHQNYFNQRYPQSPSPVMLNSPLSPQPWVPNRSQLFGTGSLPTNAPLSVQIPPNFSPSPQPIHLLERPQFPHPRIQQSFQNLPSSNPFPRFQ